MRIKLLLAALIAAASSLSAQSFVAGWDFDNVGAAAPSATANWGDLAGTATLSWSHTPAGGPPTFPAAEFGISTGFNSAIVGNTFAFVDPNTGYDQFSDGAPAGEFGFRSISSGDSFTFTFDGSGYTDLTLTYAVDTTGTGSWAMTSLDLSLFDGNPSATFVLNTAMDARYDNFAITGTLSIGGGSLFILDNAASSQLVGDWYRTPMGDLSTTHAPWIWSNDFGWHYSPESNTENTAYVYIRSAPFQCWVFVDQNSATAAGFWGYAYNASTPALNGWFWFFNEASTDNAGKFFIWDYEGQQTLDFDDQYQPQN